MNRPLLISLRVSSFLVILLSGFLFTAESWAQVNTAGIRGTVRADDDGTKLGYVEVNLVHKPSGNVKSTLTDEGGNFAFNGLRVGGPYSVKVIMDGFLPQGADGIYLSAGKKETLSFSLLIAGETIKVSGSAAGISTSGQRKFGSETIQELPSVGRDPKDVARLSPDAIIDDSEDNAISIGGANTRFNSVTIDGIRQDDDFGLNSGGYPTQRSPVSIAAIEEIAIEQSPFDVRYGKFLGGNINIVTKSGTNDFHGSIFAAYTDDNFTGTRTGDQRRTGAFNETRYGLSIGGPIVIDEAQFFLSIEGLDATTPTDIGVQGSGSANTVEDVTAAELASVQDIAQRVYGFDAGAPNCDFGRAVPCRTPSLAENDLKLLFKVDWSITNKHRVTGKYQRTSGNTIQSRFSTPNRLNMTSSWYSKNDTLDAFALQLFSDWTDQLSSELEFSGKIIDNSQTPLNGNGFASMRIASAAEGELILGPDVFRHANKLDNSLFHTKAQANYLLGKNLLTAGWELDMFSVNNLFVQSSNGDVNYASIADFEAMRPSSIFYNNSVTNIATDARADWGYQTHAIYLQDQFDATPNLTIQGGVRGEIFATNSEVVRNEEFLRKYGFENTATIDKKYLVMPRLGVSWRAIPRLNLRGGVGLYGGGAPNVWLSNSYTNDGVRTDNVTVDDPNALAGFNGRDIPDAVRNQLMAGNGNVDALDPDFAIPSTWKASVGADYKFDVPGIGSIGYDFDLKLNYVFSKVHRGVLWRDLRRDSPEIANNQPLGVLPDGRPYYDVENFNSTRGYDLLLTNANGGYGHNATASLGKSFDFGLNLSAGYSFQRVKEITPANSSTSASNYGRVAVVDPQNPGLTTSNYERAHRIIGILQFSQLLIKDITKSNKKWAEGLRTNLAMFWESRSGQPFSYTFGGDRDDLARLFGEDRTFAARNRNLFYVPDGSGDDVILDGITEGELNDFIDGAGLSKYRGKIAPRNAFRSPWFHKLDLRFTQDIPSPIKGHKGKFMLDIQNVGNLVNKNWGRFQQVNFPYVAPVVNVARDPATGKYVYSQLRNREDLIRVTVPASIWRIQMTLMYNF